MGKVKGIKDLGERKIIDIMQRRFDKMPKMPIPFGDDVSAYNVGNDMLVVIKTDMLVDKTDVPKGMSLWQAARKAVVMNVSDFAAKGVEPKVILISLGLPGRLTQRDVEEIADGLNSAAREYGAYVVGGDTNESSDLIISISLFGTAEKDSLMLRSGAKAGDIVAVTGKFGKTAAGLKILLEELEAPQKIRNVLLEAVFMPHARLREGLALSKTKAVTSAIDSSDGLAWSLFEIAKTNKVGFSIENLPLAEEAEIFAKINGLDPVELAFYGGEEYELVLTIKPNLFLRAEKAVEKVGGELFPIGKVTAERQIVLKSYGKEVYVEPRGWEHFKSE